MNTNELDAAMAAVEAEMEYSTEHKLEFENGNFEETTTTASADDETPASATPAKPASSARATPKLTFYMLSGEPIKVRVEDVVATTRPSEFANNAAQKLIPSSEMSETERVAGGYASGQGVAPQLSSTSTSNSIVPDLRTLGLEYNRGGWELTNEEVYAKLQQALAHGVRQNAKKNFRLEAAEARRAAAVALSEESGFE